MSSLPDPHVLDAEANMLRQQAAALHKAGNDALQRDVEVARTWHKEHDPERQSEAKQAEADRAEAKMWAKDAASNRAMAEASEKAARAAQDKGLISDAEEAREAAQRQRALAEQEEATAQRAESSAAAHEARVSQLNAEADALWVKESNAIEKVADQIDEKVRFLSEAAQKQREADAMRDRGDTTGAAEAERAAGYFIEQADTRRIDVSEVPPTILEEAGVREDVLNRPQQEPATDPMDVPQAPPPGPQPHPEDVPPAQVADAGDSADDPFAFDDAEVASADDELASGGGDESFVTETQPAFEPDAQIAAYEPEVAPEPETFDTDSLA